MNLPRVRSVDPDSPAGRAGVAVGDAVVAVCDEPVRDVIQYRLLTDEPLVSLELLRGGLALTVEVEKRPGEPLGLEVDAAVFDRVRTCDNHCDFCFIYQLPKDLRRSLYVKDDDYRLSFLYGNFTTLTRFTEADFERVVTEGLSPLYVSVHATDPHLRADLLGNRRGATSLRWLGALLEAGVVVHGQVVVCPGINDGARLEQTLCGVLDQFPALATLAVVPLGVSRFNTVARLRPHTQAEAAAVVDTVEAWQATFSDVVGRRLVYAADEYYLVAGRPFPAAASYGDFSMVEDGVGMARAFEAEFTGRAEQVGGRGAGFFAWVDGAPAAGYRAPRATSGPPRPVPGHAPVPVALSPRRGAPVAILTSRYGAAVLAPLVAQLGGRGGCDVRTVPVDNEFFGGNVAVTGLLVGADLARVLHDQPAGHRYLLPDVCLTEGKFLDGTVPAQLPRPVEVVATDGRSLREALERDA